MEFITKVQLDAAAAADWDRAEPVWAGQRPMTPSGVPLIGESRVPGLYLNAGHGSIAAQNGRST